MKIFIDYGRGFLKAEDESGNKVIIPAIAGEMQEDGFSLSSNGSSVLGITTEQGSWLFGQDAIEQSLMASRSQDNNFFLSNEFVAGVLLAITELTRASSVGVELMLSLPYDAYVKSSGDILANLAGNYKPQRVGRNKQNITIAFPVKHPTFPQNYSPLFVHFLDKKGQTVLPSTKRDTINIAIFNGGSHTIEYSTIKLIPKTLELTGIKAQSGTVEKGMYLLSSVIKQQIQEGYGQSLTDHKIFDVIKDGVLEYQNDDIDISEVVKPVKDRYVDSLLKLATTIWAKGKPVERDSLFGFIISGGQGEILKPAFETYHNNVMMSQSPQWDVVEGMKRVRKMIGG